MQYGVGGPDGTPPVGQFFSPKLAEESRLRAEREAATRTARFKAFLSDTLPSRDGLAVEKLFHLPQDADVVARIKPLMAALKVFGVSGRESLFGSIANNGGDSTVPGLALGPLGALVGAAILAAAADARPAAAAAVPPMWLADP